MKSLLIILSILLLPGLCAPAAIEQEKAFVDHNMRPFSRKQMRRQGKAKDDYGL